MPCTKLGKSITCYPSCIRAGGFGFVRIWLNVPIQFSVISGWSHCFLCLNQYYGKLEVSCSRTLNSGGSYQTQELLLRSPVLYHYAILLPVAGTLLTVFCLFCLFHLSVLSSVSPIQTHISSCWQTTEKVNELLYEKAGFGLSDQVLH